MNAREKGSLKMLGMKGMESYNSKFRGEEYELEFKRKTRNKRSSFEE